MSGLGCIKIWAHTCITQHFLCFFLFVFLPCLSLLQARSQVILSGMNASVSTARPCCLVPNKHAVYILCNWSTAVNSLDSAIDFTVRGVCVQEPFAWSCMMCRLTIKSATPARSLVACQVRTSAALYKYLIACSQRLHCMSLKCNKHNKQLAKMQHAAFREHSPSLHQMVCFAALHHHIVHTDMHRLYKACSFCAFILAL